jgi:hypothetical protein
LAEPWSLGQVKGTTDFEEEMKIESKKKKRREEERKSKRGGKGVRKKKRSKGK